MFRFAFLFTLSLIACGGQDTTGIFDLEGEFYDAPYPADFRVTAGQLDLTKHHAPTDLVVDYLAGLQQHTGFGLNSGVYFRFDHGIGMNSLPTTPSESIREDSTAFLVNVTQGSENFGKKTPVHFKLYKNERKYFGANLLAMKPFPGFPLEENTTYAAIITTAAKGSEGALKPSETLTAILGDGQTVPTNVFDSFAPLRQYLQVTPHNLAHATVFTTGSPTAIAPPIRNAIMAAPYTELADIVKDEEVVEVNFYHGVTDIPLIQFGQRPFSNTADGGQLVFDEDGNLELQGSEQGEVGIALPANSDMPIDGWPVVIYSHGTGGDYRSVVDGEMAGRLATEGLASISIDQVFHGLRSSSSLPELEFFNFSNPEAARNNVLQGAADNLWLERIVKEIELQTDRGTEKFDPNRIYFMGHSQGALVGVPYLAMTESVQASVLSGGGGLIYLTLLYKKQPIDISNIASNILDDDLDDFHPMLALLQAWIDPSDPIVFAKQISTMERPMDLFILEGIGDTYTPNVTARALSTAFGVDHIEPIVEPLQGLNVQGIISTPSPVANNCVGFSTCGLAQYRPLPGRDGHFVLFNVANAWFRAVRFLGTKANSGSAEIIGWF